MSFFEYQQCVEHANFDSGDLQGALQFHENFLNKLWLRCSKLFVRLPQPHLRKPTDTQTFQRTLRSTQVRCTLASALPYCNITEQAVTASCIST
jgi:hypothetical protein